MARWIFVLIFLVPAAWQPLASRELIPVEHFARLPEVSGFRISPEGDFAAMLVSLEGRRVAVVTSLVPGSTEKPGLAYYPEGEVRWIRWINNERVLFSIAIPYRRYGIPTVETRLAAMNRDGSKMKQMLRQKPKPKAHQHQSQIRDRVISILPHDERHFLVSMDDSKPNYPDVLKVDVKRGGYERMVRSRFPVSTWLADHEGVARIGYGYDDKNLKKEVKFRLNEKENWETIHESGVFDDPDFVPLGYGAEPHLIYVASNHEHDTLALYEFDALQQVFTKKIFSHPEFDVDGLAYSPNPLDRRVVGARYYGEAGNIFYFDEEAEERKAFVDSLLPDTTNTIVSESWNGLRLVIRSSSDTQPPLYYVIDRRDQKPQIVADYYSELPAKDMSPMRAVSYTARDGLEIPAFLTIPKDDKAEALPLVVVPHGGPFSRTIKGFSYWTQFLVSRGYAVLEPNFRGSAGYGSSFERSGYKEWGKAMQDDVTDGVKWLIEEGVADPARVCIFGGSYGGYAALMGAVKTPDLYRCAISVNGVTDLAQLRFNRRYYTNSKINREVMNDGGDEYSPIENVSKIKIPILLAHGELDRNVPYSHSDRMASKLKSKGKEYEFLTLKDGDHYLSRGDNRLAFFRALDAFLAKHLGPGAEPDQKGEAAAALGSP